jgi:hypothetical protein
MLSQIYWMRDTLTQNLTLSTSGITESNFIWQAATNMQQVSTYLTIFDQYALHSVVITITNPNTNAGGNTLPQIFTAIDNDNIVNIGSINAIQAYGTCNVANLGPGKSVTRVVFPTTENSTGNQPYATLIRAWVDSMKPTIPFFGLRFIGSSVSAAITLDFNFSFVWAFRNNT